MNDVEVKLNANQCNVFVLSTERQNLEYQNCDGTHKVRSVQCCCIEYTPVRQRVLYTGLYPGESAKPFPHALSATHLWDSSKE